MPAVMPAMAPPAVARRQNSPTKKAGASWAIAEKPDGERLRSAGQGVIHVGGRQNREDRSPPHLEQQRADILAAAEQRPAPPLHPRDQHGGPHHDPERLPFPP